MTKEQNETRTTILNSAWALMKRGSGKGIRMSDIAKAANVSRQAVYLHFSSRAELLIAVTRHIDEINNVDERMHEVLQSENGREHLRLWIEFWGNHLPKIHSVARMLMADRYTDEAAEAAWLDRMAAVRHGCNAAIKHLQKDGALAKGWSVKSATDMLASMLSVAQWEQLTQESGWSNKEYIKRMDAIAAQTFAMDS